MDHDRLVSLLARVVQVVLAGQCFLKDRVTRCFPGVLVIPGLQGTQQVLEVPLVQHPPLLLPVQIHQ